MAIASRSTESYRSGEGQASADEIVRDRSYAGTVPEGTTNPWRARFDLDHLWWLDTGAAPPVHEDNSKAGGGCSPRKASGHNRWRVRSTHQANRVTLQTRRVAPVVEVDPHVQYMETERKPIPTDRGVPREFEKA